MSFMDELPTLLRQPIGSPPVGCKCGAFLEPGWDYCPQCGDPIDGEEDMYLCSLHRKVELSQELEKGTREFRCVCLTCGATWLKPKISLGKHPDFFSLPMFRIYHRRYFERFFGVRP